MDVENTYLIIGLGNPGRRFKHNRHNIGFMVVDSLAEQLGVKFTRIQSKALVTKAIYEGQQLILAKPQTYMNLSGQAATALARYHKIPLINLLVIYDDIDLSFGNLRMRPRGSSAGQKGMKSIVDRLSSQEFPRLRVGINRPTGRMDAAAYVLQDFSKTESEMLPEIINRAVTAVRVFVTCGLEQAMNQYNPSQLIGQS